MDDISLISRQKKLFIDDFKKNEALILKIVKENSFLIIGGAGSIGQAVSKEIFIRGPQKLHVVDINENSLVELVRDLRSSFGYIKGEFKTFAIDISTNEFKAFLNTQKQYDYVLNLSAIKHVRSEKDPFTLMRMIYTNIINVVDTIELLKEKKIKKYFCVSTDKAANPVNLMGASKKIMEMFLNLKSNDISISSARFANVAFSDGSLLHGLNQRFIKKQPISAPIDIKRFFLTSQEAGQLCLLSCLFGGNNEIFFPKQSDNLKLTDFISIINKFLNSKGFEPHLCKTEELARLNTKKLINKGKWPCYFFQSDTTGEKPFEEFFTKDEEINLTNFFDVGIVSNNREYNANKLDMFYKNIKVLRNNLNWSKNDIIQEVKKILPYFSHSELNKSLDEKM